MGGGNSKVEKKKRAATKRGRHNTTGSVPDTIKPISTNKGSKSKNKMKRLSKAILYTGFSSVKDKKEGREEAGPVSNTTKADTIIDEKQAKGALSTAEAGEDGETVEQHSQDFILARRYNTKSLTASSVSVGASDEEEDEEDYEGSSNITLDFTNTVNNLQDLYIAGYPDAIAKLGYDDAPVVPSGSQSARDPISAKKNNKSVRATDDEENTLNRVTSYRPRGRSISDSLFHINPDGTRDVNVMDMQKTIKIEKSKKKKFQEMNSLLHEKNVVIDLTELDFVQVVGYGAFSEVWEGYWNGFRVAIKRLRLAADDVRFEERFLREVENLRNGNHPNVVMFFGVCLKPPCIVTEYMAGGNLYNLLHPNSEAGSELSFPVVMKMATDLAVALLHLHSLSILHRDLTPLNILLDEVGNVKISDFGLSREKAQEGSMTMTMGGICNPRWRPPEITKNKGHYSEKIDVYCFALLVWEMLTSQIPFAELDGSQAAAQVAYANLRPAIPDTCHPQLRDLIQRCWHDDPNQRPDFEDIVLQLRSITWKNPMGLLSGSPHVTYSPRFSRVYSAGTTVGVPTQPLLILQPQHQPQPTTTTKAGSKILEGGSPGSNRNSASFGTSPNSSRLSFSPNNKRNSNNNTNNTNNRNSANYNNTLTGQRNSNTFPQQSLLQQLQQQQANNNRNSLTTINNSNNRNSGGFSVNLNPSTNQATSLVGQRNSNNFTMMTSSPINNNRNSKRMSKFILDINGDLVPSPTTTTPTTTTTTTATPPNNRNSLKFPGIDSPQQTHNNRNSIKFGTNPNSPNNSFTFNNSNNNYSSPPLSTHNKNNKTPRNSTKFTTDTTTTPTSTTPPNPNITTTTPTTPTTTLNSNINTFNTITISNNIVINNNIFINKDDITTTSTPTTTPTTPTTPTPTKLIF